MLEKEETLSTGRWGDTFSSQPSFQNGPLMEGSPVFTPRCWREMRGFTNLKLPV